PRWKPNSASPTSADIRRRVKRRTRVLAAPSRAASFPPSKFGAFLTLLRTAGNVPGDPHQAQIVAGSQYRAGRESCISLGAGLYPVSDSATLSSEPPSWGSEGRPSSFGCRG